MEADIQQRMGVAMSDGEKPYDWPQIIVGVPIVFMMFYAAFFGFFFQAIAYGFNGGREAFDDLFETDASKKRAMLHSRDQL